ncbi:uncharacterized protein LOC129948051 [Eupeodes corollae]|uniref:uncharacterized protein LOC129948051 n=1 Tax=Eupeodes corollae TaxID=290404 RepID=UPI002493BCB2|nr:uncharacterized protein LOC129948051 [Eupeodes corollae]
MKFVALSVFVIAVFAINNVQGFYQEYCACPAQIVEKPVYVNCPPQTGGGSGGVIGGGNNYPQDNCYHPPCDPTNSFPVCGAVNNNCKMFPCLNALYNEKCAQKMNIENVNMMYCSGKSVGGTYTPCKLS